MTFEARIGDVALFKKKWASVYDDTHRGILVILSCYNYQGIMLFTRLDNISKDDFHQIKRL